MKVNVDGGLDVGGGAGGAGAIVRRNDGSFVVGKAPGSRMCAIQHLQSYWREQKVSC